MVARKVFYVSLLLAAGLAGLASADLTPGGSDHAIRMERRAVHNRRSPKPSPAPAPQFGDLFSFGQTSTTSQSSSSSSRSESDTTTSTSSSSSTSQTSTSSSSDTAAAASASRASQSAADASSRSASRASESAAASFSSAQQALLTSTNALGETLTLTSTIANTPTPTNTSDANKDEGDTNHTPLIIGVSVVGGVALLGALVFLYMKFGGKRFSDFNDDDADIKWPELKHDGDSAAMQPLPARRTGGAGFDMGGESDVGHDDDGRSMREYGNKGRDSFANSTVALNAPSSVGAGAYSQGGFEDGSAYGGQHGGVQGYYDPYGQGYAPGQEQGQAFYGEQAQGGGHGYADHGGYADPNAAYADPNAGYGGAPADPYARGPSPPVQQHSAQPMHNPYG
ncbi:hypothetical protein IE81DRAFT_207394 [Ceraceosorus guamensis]|uniref:Mid2 domain-containing protein n=1 Tax=Ceraceosorus guamensis TaxID=1522189 RepID=A0A316W5G1_9BASI|nr:hypothetical protein IE81DRAFT_207394 [Ceraceosorus guamensis]PWN45190.1 hypothetical protein IE81DRAFT_207394 [Ceraceosorus guamensis]